MGDAAHRIWLIRRIVIEAQNYANADTRLEPFRRGHVLALLEVGVAFGYWSMRTADHVADLIEHRQSLRRVPRLLRRG